MEQAQRREPRLHRAALTEVNRFVEIVRSPPLFQTFAVKLRRRSVAARIRRVTVAAVRVASDPAALVRGPLDSDVHRPSARTGPRCGCRRRSAPLSKAGMSVTLRDFAVFGRIPWDRRSVSNTPSP
jgi:hypothetical protein